MRKRIAICISLILVLASSCLCYGDGLYQIDAQSGQVVSAPEGSENAIELVRFSSYWAYSKESGMYLYSGEEGSGAEFSCSVYDGMYVTEGVDLVADSTAQLKIYCDGNELEFSGDTRFRDSGSYIVRDKNNNQIFSFTILSGLTGAVNSYTIPSIFFLDSVTFNDEPLSVEGSMISLMEDGFYSISYFCYDTGVNYTLSLTVDHTAPELEIIGLNEEGYARNSVTLGDTESYSTLEVYKDGEEYSYFTALTDAGDYEIVYTDEAGNSSIYNFTIRQYLDLNAWLVVVIVVLIIIGVAAFMIYTRKHTRVR